MLTLQGTTFVMYVFMSFFRIIGGTCPTGKYGFNCTLSCSGNCLYSRCHPGDGSCYSCYSKLWGQYCNFSCSALCDSTCDQHDGHCDSCVTGRWKDNCTEKCPGHCNSRGCDIVTGICDNECLVGYYGSYCNQTCSVGCPYCKRESGACQLCNTGYYGSFCNMTCPPNCQGKCNKAVGNCYDCTEGYWGLKCTETCEHQCECDQMTGNCSTCWYGHCGRNCEKTCPYDVRRCKDDTCDKDTCECSACDSGRFMGKNCEQTCPYPCYTCRMNGTCISCYSDSNRYGADCTIECKNCQRGCDFYSGQCKECVDGIFGENCDKSCTVNCKRCDRNTGQCFECLAGFWGDECTRTCPENCAVKVCDRHSGYCSSCKGHAYGTSCEKPCSIHCRLEDYDRNNEICDREGICLHQCQIGWWGPKCEDTCMNCKASKCYHDTGVCEMGCLSGYEMDANDVCIEVGGIPNTSTITTDDTTEGDPNSLERIDSDKNILSLASFVLCIAILLAILAIAGVYLFIKARRCLRKDTAATSELPTFNTPTESSQQYGGPGAQLRGDPLRNSSQISTVSGEYIDFGNGTDGYDVLRPTESNLNTNQ